MRLPRFPAGVRTLAITAVALSVACGEASAQGPAPRTVLAIYWGAESFPGTERMDVAIQRGLRAQTDAPVNYFAEYLESEEFPPETASIALRDYIHRKFEGRHIDVVIAVASAALEFALRYREELFPHVPIVFLAVGLPHEVVDHTEAGITGVVNNSPFGETLELALHLHPSTKHVFVVARAPSVEVYDEGVRSTLSRFSNRVDLTYIKEPTVPALLAAVKAIPPQSVLLYTRYAPDHPSPNVYPDEIARLIAEASPAPIYTVSELYLGSGVVGGMVRSTDDTGILVGEIARRVLGGTPPEKIPIADGPITPMFDWRQVTRFGIDRSRLPPESHILFRTPSAWEIYGWYIVGTFVVVTAQLVLITGLMTQRSRRRRAETALRAQEASLRASYDRIRLLAGRLINAQETARASIAQDLHDDICQRLAMVSTTIDRLKASSGSIQNRAMQHSFAELAIDTRILFDAIRRLSHDLHPATLRVLGLAPALKSHCGEVALRHHVQVAFTAEGDVQSIPPDVAVCCFRIAQESLRNGVVHGGARRLTVSLTTSADNLEMTITDDGCGFNLDERYGSGVGVISMEERAHAIGGSLQIVTGMKRGTTIRFRAPLKPELPERAVAISDPSVSTDSAPAEQSPVMALASPVKVQ
jgi:signal transduction histidine kinase